jgi:hypothetical protein
MFSTVDSLISKFVKLAKQLEDKAVQHTQSAFDYEQIVQKAQEASEFHHKESARATNIAAKIRNLVE